VDAVGFATDSTTLFAPPAQVASLTLSDNPLRGGDVVISWPASSEDARLRVYTYAGALLLDVPVPAPTAAFTWDGAIDGRPLPNGGYLIVVDAGGRRYRGRLFLARR
jgi:hypothetical protein